MVLMFFILYLCVGINCKDNYISLNTLIQNENNKEQLNAINQQRLDNLLDIETKYKEATKRSRNYEKIVAKRDKEQLKLNKQIQDKANRFNTVWMRSNGEGKWSGKITIARNNFKEQTEKVLPTEYLLKDTPVEQNPFYLKMLKRNQERQKAKTDFLKKNGRTWGETESLLNQLDGVVGKVNQLEKQRKTRKRLEKPKMVKIVYRNNGPQYSRFRPTYIHKPVTKYLNSYYDKPFAKRVYKKAVTLPPKPVKYEENKDHLLKAFVNDDTWRDQMQLKWREYEQKRLSSKEHEEIKKDIKKMEEEEKRALENIKKRMVQSEKELQQRSELLRKALQREREMSEKKIANEIRKKAIEFAMERNKLRRQFKQTMQNAYKQLQIDSATNGSEKVDNSEEMRQLKTSVKKVLKNLMSDEAPISIIV